ncbi:MAG TPA: folate-binding protein [Dyella sp.]|nr:folate-binding protein [Dyella sp.]
MPDTSQPTIAPTLVIEGPDALAFAQNQFSSDVSAVATGTWRFSAWLDAQGRVRNFFHLARLGPDRLLLLLRGGSADSMSHELARFVFRARLSMHVGEPQVIDTGAARPMHEVHQEGDTIQFGCGNHSLVLSNQDGADNRWRAKQVEAGWPWLPDPLLGKCLPPALSLHRLGAVSLEKGCYPGQELVARLHYRGGNKRQLCRVGLSQPVPAGTLLTSASSNTSVQLLDVVSTDHGIEALALCPVDAAGTAAPLLTGHAGSAVTATWQESWPA